MRELNLIQVLIMASHHNLVLLREGEVIRIRGATEDTPQEVIEQIKRHKTELLKFLRDKKNASDAYPHPGA